MKNLEPLIIWNYILRIYTLDLPDNALYLKLELERTGIDQPSGHGELFCFVFTSGSLTVVQYGQMRDAIALQQVQRALRDPIYTISLSLSLSFTLNSDGTSPRLALVTLYK